MLRINRFDAFVFGGRNLLDIFSLINCLFCFTGFCRHCFFLLFLGSSGQSRVLINFTLNFGSFSINRFLGFVLA